MLLTDMAAGQHASNLGAACQAGTYAWWPAEDRLTWSPGLLRIYGLQSAPAGEDGFTRLVHPEDRVRVELETSTYLGSDATSYSHSFRIVRPDGSLRRVLDRGAIEREATGSVRVIWGMNIDLTELPEVDHAEASDTVIRRLEQSEARLAAALRAGRLGVHELDLRTGSIVLDATARRIWGVLPGEPVTYATLAAGIHPDDLRATQAAIDAALVPDGPCRYEATFRVVRPPSEDVRWVHAVGDATFDGGIAVRLVGTVQDITERKLAKERLRQTEARLRPAARAGLSGVHRSTRAAAASGRPSWTAYRHVDP